MIRLVIGFFVVLSSVGFVENYGNLTIGIVCASIGLSLVTWPVLTGYFKVALKRHYDRHQQ